MWTLRIKTFISLITGSLFICFASYATSVYQDPEEFLHEAFAGRPPQASKLWINKELKQKITATLGHGLNRLRLSYWKLEGRSVWILDEIGKDEPITTGIIVNRGQVEAVRVLIFRETRGWEIRYPFFTDQFKGISLNQNNELDRGIDGISGATLSVRAVTNLARLALLLHEYSRVSKDQARQ